MSNRICRSSSKLKSNIKLNLNSDKKRERDSYFDLKRGAPVPNPFLDIDSETVILVAELCFI